MKGLLATFGVTIVDEADDTDEEMDDYRCHEEKHTDRDVEEVEVQVNGEISRAAHEVVFEETVVAEDVEGSWCPEGEFGDVVGMVQVDGSSGVDVRRPPSIPLVGELLEHGEIVDVFDDEVPVTISLLSNYLFECIV